MAGEKQGKLGFREGRRQQKRLEQKRMGDTAEKRGEHQETDCGEPPTPGRLLEYSSWTPQGDLAKSKHVR